MSLWKQGSEDLDRISGWVGVFASQTIKQRGVKRIDRMKTHYFFSYPVNHLAPKNLFHNRFAAPRPAK
jgi:hypothetical protein